MTRESFIARKTELINLVSSGLQKANVTKQDEKSFNKLLELLSQYTFENRLQKKGLLCYTIIDSLELDYSLGEKFIKFDNDIK